MRVALARALPQSRGLAPDAANSASRRLSRKRTPRSPAAAIGWLRPSSPVPPRSDHRVDTSGNQARDRSLGGVRTAHIWPDHEPPILDPLRSAVNDRDSSSCRRRIWSLPRLSGPVLCSRRTKVAGLAVLPAQRWSGAPHFGRPAPDKCSGFGLATRI